MKRPPGRYVALLLAILSLAATDRCTFAQARRVNAGGAAAQPEGNVGVYRSRNFEMMTDLEKDQAEELLVRLETMLKLVSAYWGRPNRKLIQMYVIDDIGKWPASQLGQMDPNGLQMARNGGGLTITSVRGIRGGPKLDAQAVVYATAKHGTPQHEAVHAYCGTNFGALGPVWYAEGMAEVGNYWQENDKGVKAFDNVISYLKRSRPRPLNDIVNNPLETTGDSWQNYAWRWALCHMLGHNENYTARFKPLGLAFLADKDVNFWTVYGPQAAEIEFEYLQFLKDMEPGYRCDLCSWDWKTRFKGLTGSTILACKIQADRGWQASRVKVTAGATYEISTEGDWQLGENDPPVTAAGDLFGRGRLQGVLFDDFTLSEPFDVGNQETWTAPASGDLFLRCRDNWGALEDNSGTINVKLRMQRN